MFGLAGAIEEAFDFIYDFINIIFDFPLAALYMSVFLVIITLAAKRAAIT